MAYKQNFKSPILKALVGKQHNLPQHLQDAIKAAPESPAKQTIDPPKMRKKQFEDAKGELQKRREKRPERSTRQKKEMAELSKKPRPTIDENGNIKFKKKAPKSPAKKGGPKKGSKYKGGRNVTDAAMADRKRRVDGGLPVRRKDYAPGKDGQAAFNADRRASYDNRIAKSKDIRKRLQSGEITKKEAQAERNAYGKERQKNASNKRTSADGNWDRKNSKAQTYVISRKGIKRKVSDAEKASYESVAKKTVDPTKPKKKMRKAPSPAESKARREAAKGTRKGMSKSGSSNPRRMSKSKVKKQGRPTSINGNVIKY